MWLLSDSPEMTKMKCCAIRKKLKSNVGVYTKNSLKKIYLKMSFEICWPFFSGPNVSITADVTTQNVWLDTSILFTDHLYLMLLNLCQCSINHHQLYHWKLPTYELPNKIRKICHIIWTCLWYCIFYVPYSAVRQSHRLHERQWWTYRALD